MTGPDDSATRPISVAELLAKNGTIGAAPPGGGRRRRRRGNTDSVTVAELTGEIPILRTGAFPIIDPGLDSDVDDEPETGQQLVETPPEPPAPEPVRTNGANGLKAAPQGRPVRRPEPVSRPELAAEPTPRRGRDSTPQRSNYPRPVRHPSTEPAVGAELMSPDPIEEIDESADPALDDAADLDLAIPGTIDDGAADDIDAQPDELGIGDASYLQSYLRSTSGPLYGGQTVADDLARQGSDDADVLTGDDAEVAEALEDERHGDHAGDLAEFDDAEQLSKGQLVVRGCLIAVQSIIAVVFGAGLFIAFDQLWKWNNIVALVLSVLVILGLVVGVRIVRKTEDIASTLIAVAVGALVTLGPLALLQSN
jgi:F0F1-type ATP synthase assembly protein I